MSMTDEEKIQALRLIMKRKRISQALLRANFGSSARVINILSWLESNGFISKPEDLDRWKIYYDKIEKYLADNNIECETENVDQQSEPWYLKQVTDDMLGNFFFLYLPVIAVIIGVLMLLGLYIWTKI